MDTWINHDIESNFLQVGHIIDNTRLKGLATRIATHTDIMDNPRYGACTETQVRPSRVRLFPLL